MAQDEAQVQKKNLARVLEVWEQAGPISAGDPVDRYLRARVAGLQLDLKNIRYHAALPYWEPPASLGGRYELKGHFPAMVALLHAPDGSVAQLHKTYLSEYGTKAAVPSAKKMMPSTGLNSFALRMQDVPGNVLGICEGIETACAAAMLRKIPVWPCLNGGTMARFELPDHLRGQVKKLVIFEDHDPFKPVGKVQVNGARQAEQPGALYAREAADRALQTGLRPLIITSAMVGQDMADYWQLQQAA